MDYRWALIHVLVMLLEIGWVLGYLVVRLVVRWWLLVRLVVGLLVRLLVWLVVERLRGCCAVGWLRGIGHYYCCRVVMVVVALDLILELLCCHSPFQPQYNKDHHYDPHNTADNPTGYP